MSKFEETPQWKEGQKVAEFLDAYFTAKGWEITPTTPDEERRQCLGDRHFRKPDMHLYIEYKSGLQTFYTGNVFLETISVDSAGKLGWAYTCQANYLMYAILPAKKILVLEPSSLRGMMDSLKLKFKEVPTSKGQNEGYNTHGLLVPLKYAEEHLTKQIVHIE